MKSLFLYVPCLIYVLRVVRIYRYSCEGFRKCKRELSNKRMVPCIEPNLHLAVLQTVCYGRLDSLQISVAYVGLLSEYGVQYLQNLCPYKS